MNLYLNDLKQEVVLPCCFAVQKLIEALAAKRTKATSGAIRLSASIASPKLYADQPCFHGGFTTKSSSIAIAFVNFPNSYPNSTEKLGRLNVRQCISAGIGILPLEAANKLLQAIASNR